MVTIAILMTCYNRKQQTLACLKHLFCQNGLNEFYKITVFLVDDGSTDGTGIAVKHNFPDVNLIQGNGKLFWNRGMHTAWERAALGVYNFYLWLNDDTYLYEYAIFNMLNASNEMHNHSIICGCVESPYIKDELTYGGGLHEGKKYVSNMPNGKLNLCHIINGNCVLIPEFVYTRVGNLDWKFSHAIGDHDYGLRAKSIGITSYTTGIFIASCPKNEKVAQWRRVDTTISQRLYSLYSPSSYNPPNEFFVYEKRHYGLLLALSHYFSSHLRVLFPKL